MTVADTSNRRAVLKAVWREARRSSITAFALLVVVGTLLTALFTQLPPLTVAEWEVLSQFPPRSVSTLVAQRDVLLAYAATRPSLVATALCAAYVTALALAIPGTLALSVLAGALYGVRVGWLLVAASSTVGACCCYGLSAVLGRQLAHAAWPRLLDKYAAEVANRRSHLLNYIVFLRVTPFLPNTFINVASPLVGVPLTPFALGTLIGCAPAGYAAVQAGSNLSDLNALGDLYNSRMLALGVSVGLLALSPVLLKQRRRTEPVDGSSLTASVINKARK